MHRILDIFKKNKAVSTVVGVLLIVTMVVISISAVFMWGVPYVTDMSSGSAEIRNNYGWIGEISGYQHTGYGFGFPASETKVVKKDNIEDIK